MGQLRVQQADGVAPRAESARPILYASFPRYLGDFVLWNKIANLAQKVKPTTCWFDCFFLFHPCRVAGSKRQANTFFIFCGMAVILLLCIHPTLLAISLAIGMMDLAYRRCRRG